MTASPQELLSSCVQRLSSKPGISSEAECSESLTALHVSIDLLMAQVSQVCQDAIKRRAKLLHDEANEVFLKEMGQMKNELTPWLEKRDHVLANCYQISTKLQQHQQSDFAKEVENCVKEASLLEKNMPCRLLSLDETDSSATSQKLVDFVMKLGRIIPVGTASGSALEDSFSDCISLGTASSIISTSPSKQTINYAEKTKPTKTFGVKNGHGPETNKFNSPRGCAVLPGGLVAVADGYNNRIKVVDAVGGLSDFRNLVFNIERSGTISSKQLTFTGLAVDSARGRLLMADAERGSVFLVDVTKLGASSSSNQLSDWPIVASLGTHGFQPKQFNVPLGICIDPRGEHLFICDSKNHQIKVWNMKTNDFEQTLGDFGKKVGQFVEPSYCAITELDSFASSLVLAVSDSGNNRVQLFKVDCKGDAMKLSILPIRVVGKEGSSLGQLTNPRGLTFDPNGNLLVADAGNKRMQVFAKDGTPIAAFANGIGLIPEGVAFLEGENDAIVVTDRKQHVVHFF